MSCTMLKVSLDLPLNVMNVLRNFSGLTFTVRTQYSSVEKTHSVGFPVQIDKDLHLVGFNFKVTDLVHFTISLISL